MLYLFWSRMYSSLIRFFLVHLPKLSKISLNIRPIDMMSQPTSSVCDPGIAIAREEEADICQDAWQLFLKTAEDYIKKGVQ